MVLAGHTVAVPPSGQAVITSGPHTVGRPLHCVIATGQLVMDESQTVTRAVMAQMVIALIP